MKTLEELIAERETHTVGKGIPIPVKFKKEVIEFHYESGIFITALSKILNLHFTTVHGWKRKYGTGQTHAMHGESTQADLKTKALAVTDELDNGLSTIDIANKYNITRQQYGAWKAACQGRYKEFRHLPDGVMWIKKEEKLIAGDQNIRDFRKLKEAQLAFRERVLKDMHELGYPTIEAETEIANIKTLIAAMDAVKDIK